MAYALNNSLVSVCLKFILSSCSYSFCKTSNRVLVVTSAPYDISCLQNCNIVAVRIGILYLLSGFGGSVLSSLFIRNNISVGASGALFGLLGAMLSELLTNWTIYTNKVNNINSYIYIYIYQAMFYTLCS